ncbi:MAG: BatD family protein [Candidatus Omnitrophota bacterium]|jgi:hypothetical protein
MIPNKVSQIFLICFVLLSCGRMPVAAEDISVTAEVDRRSLELGSFCQLKVTVQGEQKVEPVVLPKIEGMESRYLGPSTSITLINGRYSASRSFQYNLYPLSEGRYTIPAIDVVVNGKTYSTEPIYLDVTSSPAVGQDRLNGPKDSLQDKIFLTLSLPQREYYVNELIPVTMKLYIQNLSVRNVHYPELAHVGFAVQNSQDIEQSTEILGGLKYDAITFYAQVYPTRPGTLTLGPAEIVCDILFKNPQARSPFGRADGLLNDSFFRGLFEDYDQQTISIKSADLKIPVLPLPDEGRPKDFSGAVGQYKFDATVTPTDVKVGDPLTVRMTVTGNGNPDAVQMPTLEGEGAFKFYEPQVTENPNSKSVEQVAMPTSENIKAFPAVSFSYFETDSRQYKTITRGPFPLTISKLEEGEQLKIVGLGAAPGQPLIEPETLGQDILFIKDRPGPFYPRDHLFLFQRPGFWLLAVVLMLAWSGLYGYYHFHRKLATDSRFARRFHAPRAARAGLKQAQGFLGQGDSRQFYDILFKTVQDYFGNTFHIPGGAVSQDVVLKLLREKGAPDAVLERVRAFYAECDSVRYALVQPRREQMAGSFSRVTEMIEFVEKNGK